MSTNTVGERYARALFELAAERREVEAVTGQIQRFAAAYTTSAELRSVVDNPRVPDAQRRAVLDAVCGRLGLDPMVKSTIALMARRRRLAALPELVRAITRLADEQTGVVRATVTSATPLADADVQRIARELEGATQRRVLIERRHDPALIGGIITRIGDQVIDGSLEGRLAALERRLLQA